jgi:hypothetical protein
VASIPFRKQVMARQERRRKSDDWLFPDLVTQSGTEETSLLDVVDSVLNHGVVLNGDLILGVANVDLIYAKLSVLLAALDRVTDESVFRPVPAGPGKRKRRKLKTRR